MADVGTKRVIEEVEGSPPLSNYYAVIHSVTAGPRRIRLDYLKSPLYELVGSDGENIIDSNDRIIVA